MIACVVIQVIPIPGLQEHHIGKRSQNRLVALITVEQRLLGEFAIGYVSNISDEVNRASIVIFNYRTIQINPDSMPILVDITFLEIERADLAANQTLALAPVRFKIVRMRDVLELSRQEFRFCVSQQ